MFQFKFFIESYNLALGTLKNVIHLPEVVRRMSGCLLIPQGKLEQSICCKNINRCVNYVTKANHLGKYR